MPRRSAMSALWQHFVRGLIITGCLNGGSAQLYPEYLRAREEAEAEAAGDVDWSIPHRWFDLAH
ncbi:hypothetical protein [Amycolatopsis sp.]|uniref:hypothetical protein n=1 Tax=Amycolatopsis sp. TaxID=37632 RepID=UPI002CA5DE3F|nr:hypothetical protein [Amycolatopsis sp.]HVV12619.1 hypothetical protein [Amycolatopsis sp.]